jgi:hypothetical protein
MKKRVVDEVGREVTENGNQQKKATQTLFLWLRLKILSDLIRCAAGASEIGCSMSAEIGLEKHTMDIV